MVPLQFFNKHGLHRMVQTHTYNKWLTHISTLHFRLVRQVPQNWTTENRANRLEEVTLTRLRTLCTYITHTKPMMNRTFPDRCDSCQVPLTISHILLACSKYRAQRQSLLAYFHSYNRPFILRHLLSDDERVITAPFLFLRQSDLLAII